MIHKLWSSQGLSGSRTGRLQSSIDKPKTWILSGGQRALAWQNLKMVWGTFLFTHRLCGLPLGRTVCHALNALCSLGSLPPVTKQTHALNGIFLQILTNLKVPPVNAAWSFDLQNKNCLLPVKILFHIRPTQTLCGSRLKIFQFYWTFEIDSLEFH